MNKRLLAVVAAIVAGAVLIVNPRDYDEDHRVPLGSGERRATLRTSAPSAGLVQIRKTQPRTLLARMCAPAV